LTLQKCFEKVHTFSSQFFSFLTSSCLFLALNSALVVTIGFVLYNTEISLVILTAAFSVTLSVYTLNRVTDKTEDSINRPEVGVNYSKYYLLVSLAGFAFSLGIGLIEGISLVFVLAFPLLGGFFYSVRFSRRIPRLKEVVGVKSILVSANWALSGSVLPALMKPVDIELVLLVFIYIFFSLLVNTVIFDVLDLNGDKVGGVKTIPFVLGSRRTKLFLILVNSCLVGWLIYSASRSLFLSCMPALVFGVLYGYLMIGYFMANRFKRKLAELLIDGEWIPLAAILSVFFR